MLRKGHELGSRRPDWRYPSAQWVADAERKLAQANRLLAIVRGEDKPKDNAERLTFAQIAYGRKHFATSARLCGEALETDPKLGDRQVGHRYIAACAAALAAAGQGQTSPSSTTRRSQSFASRPTTGSRPSWLPGPSSSNRARPRRGGSLSKP